MSFQPVLQLVRLPRTQDSITLRDATGTYPAAPAGYGAPGAPASGADVLFLFADLWNYGDPAAVLPLMMSGNLFVNDLTLTVPVKSGVNVVRVWYRQSWEHPWSLSEDGRTLTVQGDLGDRSVHAFSYMDPDYPVPVSVAHDNTFLLDSPLSTTVTQGQWLYFYTAATINVLVQYAAEERLVNRIAAMPLDEDFRQPITPLVEDLLLQQAAVIDFGSGRWSKAHQAALLACGITPPLLTKNYPKL